MATDARRTVWVFGDQLHRSIGALGSATPGDARILLVTSTAKVGGRPWHRQRLHLYLAAMRRFAIELRAEGFKVDEVTAPTFRAGLADHVARCSPTEVVATEPNSLAARRLLADLGVRTVRSDQFLCHPDDFAEWAATRPGRLRMEDFYRWQRSRLGVLVAPDGEPEGGRWNYDAENRDPPPKDGRAWPAAPPFPLDDLDREVLAGLPESATGEDPTGLWPTTRAQALERLDAFVRDGLPVFGPHEDAMLAAEWKLAHSVLSSSLNLGLLLPGEVVQAAVDAYERGDAPLAGVEGFVRQVLGWREYVWGLRWLWAEDWTRWNELGADRPLPPLFSGGTTHMACVGNVVDKVGRTAYAHHIERLMVLGNLCLLSGVQPQALVGWMWEQFIDGAEWVMQPNVVGMSLHADGGQMATKPYASGGAYISKMSDHCKGCRYDPKQRTGPDACPFSTLYWDFLARHEERFAPNHRMGNQLGSMRRLKDLDGLRVRAVEVLDLLDAGDL